MNAKILLALALADPVYAQETSPELTPNPDWINTIAEEIYREEILGSYLCAFNKEAGLALDDNCSVPPPAGTAIILPPKRLLECELSKDLGVPCPPMTEVEKQDPMFTTMDPDSRACIEAMRTIHPEWALGYVVMIAKSLDIESRTTPLEARRAFCSDPEKLENMPLKQLPFNKAFLAANVKIDFVEGHMSNVTLTSAGAATDGQGRPVQ